MRNLTFGAALEAAKRCQRIARASKPLQYHFFRLSTFVPPTFVMKMNSLPFGVLRAADEAHQGIAFTRDFGIATWDETGKLIISSWQPTFEDLVAEDWWVLD